ncbi:restriction endonuclease NgoPII [Gallibacterium genomosp. 3]|uniref:Restriction endonuclease NgoPII n=1 Tax=Gallibacterium genomosp. 3 TaxID=505345 RepID=A0A1A7NKE6_9PAST|nr:NgoPII family restriction endonuclease [Gallibacterium genomosp. 3]OBW90637.1 restriction endonuclease NgoPII [Gallibacterium genomosp. 3]
MNILNAIMSLIKSPIFELREYADTHNRVNNMGQALEEYIKDLFADSVNDTDSNERDKKRSKTFSYLGNKNNPPDAMLINGDAIEVKKIENINSTLALNSSYPKNKLYSTNTLINRACRECEEWNVKDMLYTIGWVNQNRLKFLCFVYGDEYCADKLTYENTRQVLKDGIENIPSVEFAETNELARINRVDPLGITYLRIRGMWGIENPLKVFSYIYKYSEKEFSFMALINQEKFDSFSNKLEFLQFIENNSKAKIQDVEVKDPNNPAKLKSAKLITFEI